MFIFFSVTSISAQEDPDTSQNPPGDQLTPSYTTQRHLKKLTPEEANQNLLDQYQKSYFDQYLHDHPVAIDDGLELMAIVFKKEFQLVDLPSTIHLSPLCAQVEANLQKEFQDKNDEERKLSKYSDQLSEQYLLAKVKDNNPDALNDFKELKREIKYQDDIVQKFHDKHQIKLDDLDNQIEQQGLTPDLRSQASALDDQSRLEEANLEAWDEYNDKFTIEIRDESDQVSAFNEFKEKAAKVDKPTSYYREEISKVQKEIRKLEESQYPLNYRISEIRTAAVAGKQIDCVEFDLTGRSKACPPSPLCATYNKAEDGSCVLISGKDYDGNTCIIPEQTRNPNFLESIGHCDDGICKACNTNVPLLHPAYVYKNSIKLNKDNPCMAWARCGCGTKGDMNQVPTWFEDFTSCGQAKVCWQGSCVDEQAANTQQLTSLNQKKLTAPSCKKKVHPTFSDYTTIKCDWDLTIPE